MAVCTHKLNNWVFWLVNTDWCPSLIGQCDPLTTLNTSAIGDKGKAISSKILFSSISNRYLVWSSPGQQETDSSQVNAKISIYPTTWISAASANCLQAAEAINISRAQLETKGRLRNEMQTHLDKSSSFTVNHSDLKLLELLSCFYQSNLNSKKEKI